jgi:hypothetical protein
VATGGRSEYRLWSLLSKSDVYSRKGYLTKQLGDSQNTTRLSYEVSAYRERHIHRQGIRLSYKKNPKQLQATTQREQGTTARNNKGAACGSRNQGFFKCLSEASCLSPNRASKRKRANARWDDRREE